MNEFISSLTENLLLILEDEFHKHAPELQQRLLSEISFLTSKLNQWILDKGARIREFENEQR